MARSGFGDRFPARNSAVSKALAANVRRLRKERGWTQDDLAAETKVEQAAISLIENGRAIPTLLMLESIARALASLSRPRRDNGAPRTNRRRRHRRASRATRLLRG
jgi:transcriptional regulator with XRE-family HTH domain